MKKKEGVRIEAGNKKKKKFFLKETKQVGKLVGFE